LNSSGTIPTIPLSGSSGIRNIITQGPRRTSDVRPLLKARDAASRG
jgi:hypothetical protein